MKFKSGTRRRALEYEKDIVQQWKKNKTFEKSIENRPKENGYVFYDGPPFITGVPHHGTLLSSIAKDLIPRYQTMKGKRVERIWGWDCHGLPAEVFTEKKLGVKDRRDIGTKISIEEYVTTCRENMVQTGNLWNDTIDRIGRWVDMDNAYKTMDKEYMESIWWAFKKLYDDDKIYEGERVLMYCTRDATPLSKAEVTMDSGAYQDVTDPSIYTKFKLKGELKDFNFATSSHSGSRGDRAEEREMIAKGRSRDPLKILSEHASGSVHMLAWTTTPWTLPANTALAVNDELAYSLIFVDDTFLILATELVESVLTDEKHNPLEYVVINNMISGNQLVGLKYEPLFEDRGENAHKVLHADYVSDEDGTGIVHLAPAYGEEDFNMAHEENIPVVHVIDESGIYSEGEWIGENVWDINKTIAKTLHERGIVWKIDYIQHSYPHCHRCGTRLMYRAHPSWFMDIAGQKEQMLAENSKDINWFPSHLKHGRFEKTVEAAPDWNISRDRFWATAMPVWKGTDSNGKEHIKVVGSYAELKELSGVELEDYHRPWVDDVTFEIDGVKYTRIEKVLDGWFESGSMPFAQFHYPFENKKKFENNFPGDFITEYIGQVRAWFYYMHAVSVGLFGTSSFKNVITTGNLAGSDGRKMSKSYGNFTDPNILMDEYSADSLRFLLMQSPLMNSEDFALTDKDVGDVARKLSMIWNMYDFFTLYAEVDEWGWNGAHEDPTSELDNSLDNWIVSRVHQLTEEVDRHLAAYDIPSALKPILPFLDDASNWYVRRSRRRFWKSGETSDKNNAYKTLHYVLVQLSMVIAPVTPFLAEELYQKLTGGESVHLLDWPSSGHVNEILVAQMSDVRELINAGLSQRAKAQLKVRQPLRSFTITGEKADDVANFIDVFEEELNVKKVIFVEDKSDELIGELDLELDDDLLLEGMMREVIRHIQTHRKKSELNIDDRIKLKLETDDETLKQAIDKHEQTILNETLATLADVSGNRKTVKINGVELTISLQKI
ncbi:isoleucine--tRNA ligase [Candidatus Saccharibacteria bacterium]|nr:isoleucine--tRNA ligase [Candidatus Saccharibacteria bacterium]